MITYQTQQTAYNYQNKRLTNKWLAKVADLEGKSLGDISFIFCSDDYLLGINMQYLNHDYYTDVITFDYCEDDVISGDIFISVDTVRKNAMFYEEPFEREMHRVIVHGVLHLIGYDDQTTPEEDLMRQKEDEALDLWDSIISNIS